MDEIVEGIFHLILKLFIGFLKLLRYFAFELMFEGLGWAVGWLVLRLITLGRYPKQGFFHSNDASILVSIGIEIVGMLVLCVVFLALFARMIF